MKVFHIFFIFFIVLIAVWQYYGRKLYYDNNEKNRKRYRVLKIILNFVLLIGIVFGLFRFCSSEKRANLELSTSSFDFGSIQKDSIYEGKEIILPNDTCMLAFLYNTRNKTGKQENYITIIANTDSLVHLLQINAYVD